MKVPKTKQLLYQNFNKNYNYFRIRKKEKNITDLINNSKMHLNLINFKA